MTILYIGQAINRLLIKYLVSLNILYTNELTDYTKLVQLCFSHSNIITEYVDLIK